VNSPPRRTLLRRALQVASFAALSPLMYSVRGAESCVDPSSDSLRSSLNYKVPAADPKQVCGACSFFTPSKANVACGNCAIMSGPVDAQGHCDSWTAKS